jgi:GNAT superfamily N-acetyltransferase
MSVRWRDADRSDALALAELGRDTFVETFGHLYRPDDLALFLETHNAADWAAEIADPACAVRIGEADGRLVAYAKVGPPKLPFATGAGAIELRQFYIRGPWQGRGLADPLMNWALAEARHRGADAMYLSVFTDNHRARKFYARHGFAEVGPYAFMVGSHADEDIVMRLEL